MKGKSGKNSKLEEKQYFGFLPQTSIAKMQSPEYDKRIESSQEILEYVPTIPIEEIDITGFLKFIQEYITDGNLKVAQNCSLIVEEIISALKPTNSIPIHLCVLIAFDQLKDKRRFVIQLGGAVIGDLLRATDQKQVLAEIIKSSSTAQPNLLTQIFRTFTNLITSKILEPSLLLDYPFYFDSGLTSPNDNVKQAALWCVDFLKANYSNIYEQLFNQLSSNAAKVVGRTPMQHNPATAIPKNRTVGPQIIRPINTAGVVEAVKNNLSMSQKAGSYRRPALPSAGARRLFSMSRPVSSTFPNQVDLDKPLEKFNFEPIPAPPEPEHDDDVLFGDLPEPFTNSNITTNDSNPPSLLNFGNNNKQTFNKASTYHPTIKRPLDNIFETDLELDDFKPKVQHSHFENAVFEDIPKAKLVPPKQPRSLRSKLHKEYDEQNTQKTAQFGGSHFDESAFNEIQPLNQPKSRTTSAFGDHQGIRENDSFGTLPTKKFTGSKVRNLPPMLGEITKREENQKSSGRESDRDAPKSKSRSASAFGNENPDSLAVVPTKQKKSKAVKFSELPPPEETASKPFDPDSRPIHTSGAYNFGDDDLFGDDTEYIPPKAITKPRKPPKKVVKIKTQSAPPTTAPAKARKPPSTPNPQTLIENLQSDDWDVQNKAIETLSKGVPKDVIKSSLRNAISNLLECAQSTRTALAKNALNLILMWIEDKEIPITSVSDIMSTRLLKLLQQQSSHHFIADLAGKCFIALLENVPENKICSIVARESKSPYAPARAMVANGISSILSKIEDPTPLLTPLASLGKDADQNARKYAKMAVKEIAKKQPNFADYVKMNVPSKDDQSTLIKMSSAPL